MPVGCTCSGGTGLWSMGNCIFLHRQSDDIAKIVITKLKIKNKNKGQTYTAGYRKHQPNKSKIKKRLIKDQHNTDDGAQAMGEEMRHVQMSR